MARTALVTLLLSSSAVLTYIGYRALDLVPVPEAAQIVAASEPVEMLPEFTLDNPDGVLSHLVGPSGFELPQRPVLVADLAGWLYTVARPTEGMKRTVAQQHQKKAAAGEKVAAGWRGVAIVIRAIKDSHSYGKTIKLSQRRSSVRQRSLL